MSATPPPAPVLAYGLTGVVGVSVLSALASLVGRQLPVAGPIFASLPFGAFLSAVIVAAVAGYVLIKVANAAAKANSPLAIPYLAMVSQWFGSKDVLKDSTEYADFFDASKGGNVEKRNKEYMTMVNHYYNLVTDFYEYGWGYSFHFGRRFKGEDFHASLARHEQWLGLRGGFQPGQTIIDLGCGVGGPMRCIARFTGATIIGVNNNAYQIKRGTKQVEEAGLSELCSFKQSDFMKLDFKDNSIDGAYAIEATCHAPDKAACFAEILRVLKPGATFVGYEWVMTDKWDPKNKTHAQIKHGIEVGDSLPDLPLWKEVPRALKAAGFEVVETKDVAPLEGMNSVPWYDTIQSTGGFKNFKSSKTGIWLTHQMVRVLEFIRLAPAGTVKTHEWLSSAIGPLAAGGQTGIFTPMYYFKATKPKK